MILYKKKLQVDKEDFQLETTELYYFFEVVKMEPKKNNHPDFQIWIRWLRRTAIFSN